MPSLLPGQCFSTAGRATPAPVIPALQALLAYPVLCLGLGAGLDVWVGQPSHLPLPLQPSLWIEVK